MRSRKTAIEMAAEAKNKAPCMECKRRAVGCHSACIDYGAFKKRLSNAQREMVERNKKDILEDGYKYVSREKYRKEKEK